jgi:hypothetical protein
MTKQDAITMFGEVKHLAAVLGITQQAIYQWPSELPQSYVDRINGAAMRIGIAVKSDQIQSREQDAA